MDNAEWVKASNAFFHVFFAFPVSSKLHRQYKALYDNLDDMRKAMLSDPEFADGMTDDEESYLQDLMDEAVAFNNPTHSEGL
jgi:hypothetical protein